MISRSSADDASATQDDVVVRHEVDVASGPRSVAEAPERVDRRRVSWWAWLPAALVVLTLELRWLTRRCLWQDELATLSASRRSVPELVSLLKHTDAVLGPYYLLIHLWTRVAGTSPASLRLPSALAMAMAVGVTAHLSARLFGDAAGLVTGGVLAACPAVLLYGTEARAYAITALLAATSTWLLVQALTSADGRRWWVSYAAVLVLLGWTQVTALTVWPAHLLAVAALPWAWPGGPRRMRAVACAGAAATIGALPMLVVGRLQSHQVAWIPSPTVERVTHLPALASGSERLGWVLVTAGLLVLAVAWTSSQRRGRRPTTRPMPDRAPLPLPFGATLGAGLAVIPVLLITVISLVTPLTVPRYVLFTVVGWALLSGGALTSLATRPGRAGLLVPLLLVGVCVGVGSHDRAEVGAATRRAQPDFRALAAQLRTHEQPGDAIVVPTDAGRRFRIGVQTYLGDGVWPRDVLLVADAVSADRLDARECSPATCLGRPPRLWVGCSGVCKDPLAGLTPATRALIRADGYRPLGSWRAGHGRLTLYRLPDAG